MKMCPPGWYASDFNVQIEWWKKKNDDTSLNGLKLRCKNPGNYQTTDITVFEGLWGEWVTWHPVN